MANRSGNTVQGLNKLVRSLTEFGLDIEDLKDSFSQIATEGADTAQRYVPRDTGKLAASIRPNRAKNKAVVTAGRASVKYAGPINYGWPKRGIRAAEFMQKADEDLRPRALQMLEAEINRKINERGLG